MGQVKSTLEKIEQKLGTVTKKVPDDEGKNPSSSSSSSHVTPRPLSNVHYNYSNLDSTFSSSPMSTRLVSLLSSYQQLSNDVRLINLNYSKHFLDSNGQKWRFHILSKIPHSTLIKCKEFKGEWTKKGNVIIAAGKVENEKGSGSRNGSAASSLNTTASTPSPLQQTITNTSSSPSPSLITPSPFPSSSPSPSGHPFSPSTPRFTLTMRQFYSIFLYYGDHLAMMQAGAKHVNPSSASASDPHGEDSLCSICLNNDVEIVLQCEHSFCRECISDWTENHDSCPLCRANANIEGTENWDISIGSVKDEVSKEAIVESMTLCVKAMDQFIMGREKFNYSVVDMRETQNQSNGKSAVVMEKKESHEEKGEEKKDLQEQNSHSHSVPSSIISDTLSSSSSPSPSPSLSPSTGSDTPLSTIPSSSSSTNLPLTSSSNPIPIVTTDE